MKEGAEECETKGFTAAVVWGLVEQHSAGRVRLVARFHLALRETPTGSSCRLFSRD